MAPHQGFPARGVLLMMWRRSADECEAGVLEPGGALPELEVSVPSAWAGRTRTQGRRRAKQRGPGGRAQSPASHSDYSAHVSRPRARAIKPCSNCASPATRGSSSRMPRVIGNACGSSGKLTSPGGGIRGLRLPSRARQLPCDKSLRVDDHYMNSADSVGRRHSGLRQRWAGPAWPDRGASRARPGG